MFPPGEGKLFAGGVYAFGFLAIHPSKTGFDGVWGKSHCNQKLKKERGVNRCKTC